MIVAALLHLLAAVDATLRGYAAAAGRDARIAKWDYYRQAMTRGFLFGQAAVAVAALAVALALALSPRRVLLWADFQRVGVRMLQVYLPYAAVIGAAFAARAAPHVDLRSLTSTLIFGPLTFLRPAVAVAGLAWGVAAAPHPEIVALGVLVLVMMLGLEDALAWSFVRRPPR